MHIYTRHYQVRLYRDTSGRRTYIGSFTYRGNEIPAEIVERLDDGERDQLNRWIARREMPVPLPPNLLGARLRVRASVACAEQLLDTAAHLLHGITLTPNDRHRLASTRSRIEHAFRSNGIPTVNELLAAR